MADSIYGEEGGVNMDTALVDAANQQGYILNNGNNTTALGNIYSDVNTNPNGYTPTTNVYGSTNATAAADNSGNTAALTAADTAGFPVGGSLKDLQKFIEDNKGLITAGGALAGLMGGATNQYGKTGYQGSIPELTATRNMITAPPTKAQGYRPGAGGVNYGGDVSYTRTPGIDPWAFLSGNSGTLAGANLTTPGSTKVTLDGKTTVPFVDTNAKVTTTGLTADQQAVANWKKGLTSQQYLSQINQWIADHPNLTSKELADNLAKFQVSATDLQTALGQNKNLSAADIYALSHGQGLAEANAQQTTNINKWIADHPYATAKEIADAIKGSGVNTGDINQALTGTKLSGAVQAALTGGMGVDQLYKNILDYQASGHTPAEIAAAQAQYKVSDADMAAAAKYAQDTKYTPTVQAPTTQAAVPEHNLEDTIHAIIAEQKALQNQSVNQNLANLGLGDVINTPVPETPAFEKYSYDPYSEAFAEGGMAKGRYLQGGTDGMADEIPAQIGEDQPAALSHGEFVVPADVVSHLGNGNSDAGAKKLYQMMDKIRMARTGNKKQGKKINPDKFMPGGLAQAYASGGSVKHFLEGGTTTTPTGVASAVNQGIAGVESNLSNWAGPYVTNMLGQGQALANMAYQPYMGQLTAGESSLQNKVSQGLGSLNFPGNLGQSFSSTGAYTPPAMNTSAYQPAPIGEGAGATPNIGLNMGTTNGGIGAAPNNGITAADTMSNPNGIASQYMNPYLQNVLTPQLEELRRQNDITNMNTNAKLTQAGAFGGGRQAIMNSENNRNLLQAQNQAIGTGYANAYDKGMQQFNTEQGQANTLANMMATQGATQRGIESEGIAADKAQFEEARANPYKMVQYQQSLLQGLPLAAQSYQGISPSALTSAAQGATTVAQLLKNLGIPTIS